MRTSYAGNGSSAKGGVAFAAGALLLLAFAMAAPAKAGSLREGSAGKTVESESTSAGGNPGSFLDGFYDVGDDIDPIRFAGDGDNRLSLVNSTADNGTICALIWVIDADQELGECCGCPVSPNGLLTFSVETDLIDNWEISGDEFHSGTIAIDSVIPNNRLCLGPGGVGTNPACNGGCDPSQGQPDITVPGLSGYITGSQIIGTHKSLTEREMIDEGNADADEENNLTTLCSFVVSNGSGKGFCHCPKESD